MAVGSALGLVLGLLVRPKNRAADLAAGAFTGLVCGLTVFTLSAGSLAVIATAVQPIRNDLRELSEAAWAESPRGGRAAPAGTGRPGPAERLLERYPDLRRIPARERGEVFYQKVRSDLIAGIPLGIWFGALVPLAAAVLIFTIQVMAAGPLLRRHGVRAAVAAPYFERVVPAMLLIVFSAGLVGVPALMGPWFLRPLLTWFLTTIALSGLALAAALRGWPWPVRLLLHAGWLFSLGMLVVRTLPK
jgi:hypothetical protein